MKTRVLAAIPIGIILIAALILQSWVLLGLIVLLSVLAQKEIIGAAASDGTKIVSPVCYAANIIMPVCFLFLGSTAVYALAVFYMILLLLLFIVTMFKEDYGFEAFRSTLLCMVYPQFFFMFMYLVFVQFMGFEFIGSNPFIFLMAILPPIFSDTMAYFVGRACGKKKLCPKLSPKKTVEGAIGGVMGGVIAGFLVWLLFGSGIIWLSFNMHPAAVIIMGGVAAFISQLGDLAASFIKRHYGIKDYGHLIPGHGGILDRIDSMLFAFPTVYIFCMAAAFLTLI